MNLTREESRQLLDQSMLQLAGDVRFQAFMGLVRDSRDSVCTDLCGDDVVESDRKTLAAIGELRVYQHLIDTYEEVRVKVGVASGPGGES